MALTDLMDRLAHRWSAPELGHPIRIGIDGPCGVGKSTFRHALADRLRAQSAPVLELDSDGFHHTRAIRYRQGRHSARGYYDDSYDFGALEQLVLRPLGPGGTRRIVTKVHDLHSDEVVREETVVEPEAIVLFDCTFLQRGKLREHWDEVVYLTTDLATSRRRGTTRDAIALGGLEAAVVAYDQRYLAAYRIYEQEERPEERASIVIDHTDLDDPRLLRS